MPPNFEEDGELMVSEGPASLAPLTTQPSSTGSAINSSWFAPHRRGISAWLRITLLSPGVLPAPWSHSIFGYLFAVLGQVLVITLVHYFIPFLHLPSALVLLVILLVALGWGVGPSLVATLVGGILMLTLTILPNLSLGLEQEDDIVRLLLYIVVGFVIGLLISQLQLERRATKALYQRLVNLLALAHDAVIVRDPENHILLWNQGAERLYGWTEEEALGNITHTWLSTRLPTFHEMVEVDTQLDITGRWDGRLIHTCHDGQEVLVESQQVLVRNASGKPEAILEINRDITGRERLVQERVEAQAKALAARESTSLMEEFLGIVGHELRTPLTSIKASVQLARRSLKRLKSPENTLSAKVPPLIHTIDSLLERTERQVEMQNRLVNDLLDTSRIQAGHLELNMQRYDIAILVQQVAENHNALTLGRTIYVETPEQAELPVMIDVDRLRQVIANYLSNAIKYSDSNKPVKVRVQAEPDGSHVRVAVSDEGPGLSQEQQQHLWERFYRVPGIEIKSGSGVGLGLGLHISRMLIERQGGQVGVQSQSGQGSTFWFTLRLADHDKDDEA
jgi:PAS domain S-box-containing protein